MESQVKASVLDAIGNTPVVRLARMFPGSDVVAKLEYMNPSGSIKDRMVRFMLSSLPAETLRVVESSSGNTGAALAMACAVLGLDCEIAVPETTSIEKIKRIRAYGANAHLCSTNDPACDYQTFAEAMAQAAGTFHLDQYRSALNSAAHYSDTGPEMWNQMAGEIDIFISGIGSGGTISGIGRYFKERNPEIIVIGVEPLHSSYLNLVTNQAGEGKYETQIEGVGKSSPSPSFDPRFVDDVIQVPDDDALRWMRRLADVEGIYAGGSSGCVAAAVAKVLSTYPEHRIATIFPDSAAFYASKYP